VRDASAEFDAYYKWLGIPSKDQPPNHYRLLALEPFEIDRDVIANAAEQRMMLIRSFQSGENCRHSQQLLNELATAKLCLLNPQRKEEYDAQLRQILGVRSDGGTRKPPRPINSVSPQATNSTGHSVMIKAAERKRPQPIYSAWLMPAILGTLGAAFLIGLGILYWSDNSSNSLGALAPPDRPGKIVVGPTPVGSSTNGQAALTGGPRAVKPEVPQESLQLEVVPFQKLGWNDSLRVKIRAKEVSRPFENLRFSLASDVPQGMSIGAENGLIEWRPSDEERGRRYVIRIFAIDGIRRAETSFEVAVEDQLKLDLKPVGDQVVAAGSKLQVKLETESNSASRLPLVYSLLSAPKGATLDAASGEFTWEPDSEKAGQAFEAKIGVATSDGQRAEVSFPIQVAQIPPQEKNASPTEGENATVRRLPIPDLTDQKSALQVIRQIFGQPGNTPEEQRIMAEKLLQEGNKTSEDAVGRYVLYSEAADLAISAGDVKLFLSVIDAMASHYEVDAIKVKQQQLIDFSNVRNEDLAKEVTGALLELLNLRIKQEEWEDAADIIKGAQQAAIKSRDAELRRYVTVRSREVTALAKAHTEKVQALETVSKDGKNAEANHVVGLYLAFVQGEWAAALPYLSKGSDKGLAALARRELEKPVAAEAKKEIADQWAALAKGRMSDATAKRLLEASSTARNHVREHAIAWYKLALGDAQGLTKRAIEQQLTALQTGDQGMFGFEATCRRGTSRIIDNSAATFVGNWSSYTGSSYGPSSHYANAGNGALTATFHFTGLAPGQFDVFATWFAHTNRGTNVPFTVTGGKSPVTVLVNQKLPPNRDATVEGINFALLTTVTVSRSTLSVTIANKANGIVITDAVRIQCK